MTSRTAEMLRASAPRESSRVDLALARGIFLVIAFPILLVPATLLSAQFPTGQLLLRIFSAPSLLLVLFLALRLAGDTVGDRRSGWLELLILTGVRPPQWILLRLLQTAVAFLSVWIVRLPLLALIFCFGGVRLPDILARELLLVTLFLAFWSVGVLAAHRAKSRQEIPGWVVTTVFAVEILFLVPSGIANLLGDLMNWQAPTWFARAADELMQFGLFSSIRLAATEPIEAGTVGRTLALYAGVAGGALLWFASRLSADVSEVQAESRGTVGKAKALTRESRRCWDDALAWQACAVHTEEFLNSTSNSRGVVALYVAMAIAFCGLLQLPGGIPWEGGLTMSVLALCLGRFLMSANKPSDCLQKELREATLPTLLLTPHEPVDLYDGWRRGSWRLCRVDLVVFGFVVVATLPMNPDFSMPVLAVGCGILASGPFLMLSGVVPYTVRGIATGCSVVLVLVVVAVTGIGIGAAVSPLLAPWLVIPLCWLFNRALRRFVLPGWLNGKVSSALGSPARDGALR